MKNSSLLAAQHLARALPGPVPVNPPLPQGGAQRNAIPLYVFPAQRITNHYVERAPLRVSALRSLGAHVNVFALESFMDELAQAAAANPVEFRLRYLKRGTHQPLTAVALLRALRLCLGLRPPRPDTG